MKLKQLDMEDLGTVRKLFVKIFSQEPWNDCWDDPEQLRRYMEELLGTPMLCVWGCLRMMYWLAFPWGGSGTGIRERSIGLTSWGLTRSARGWAQVGVFSS